MSFFSRKPLVSVVLPSCNHAAYVGAAIRSVLDQTERNLELIVVDDGSSDTTPDVVASIHDPRLTLIRVSENRAIHPRNLAISHARGKYVAFQNSDGLWELGKLAAQLEVMESQPGYAACFTGVSLMDADGMPACGTWANQLFTTENRPAHTWLRYFFDIGNCLPLASAMVQRADLVRLGAFRESLVQLSDLDLWIRLAAEGAFFILPEKLTKIRILQNAKLSGPSLRTARRASIELVTILERYAQAPILNQLSFIFPDMPTFASLGANKVALALYAWSRGGVYALLADRIVAEVLENSDERADAVAVHGTVFIHTFLTRRCEYEFIEQCDQSTPKIQTASCSTQ